MQGVETNDMPISTGSTFALDATQIESYTKKAKNGDKEAAFKLYQYFTFSRYDENHSMYWLELSAKLGHTVAQYNLALHYEEIGDIENAAMWGKKAYAGGEEKAKRFFK